MQHFKNIPNKRYDIIYADPPWRYGSPTSAGGFQNVSKSSSQYSTLSLSELGSFPIKNLMKPNVLLFLWTTGPVMSEAIWLGAEWGFKYKQVAFMWHKQNKVYGKYTITSCEFCLVFKKGKIPVPRGAKNILQFVSLPAEKHSKKPDEVRNRITQMFPTQDKIELFARSQSEGWDAWGNEIGN